MSVSGMDLRYALEAIAGSIRSLGSKTAEAQVFSAAFVAALETVGEKDAAKVAKLAVSEFKKVMT